MLEFCTLLEHVEDGPPTLHAESPSLEKAYFTLTVYMACGKGSVGLDTSAHAPCGEGRGPRVSL